MESVTQIPKFKILSICASSGNDRKLLFANEISTPSKTGPNDTFNKQMVDFGSMYMQKMLQISSYARGSSNPTSEENFAQKENSSYFTKRKNPYDILTKISRWTIFMYHVRATLIGLWILLKWFFQFIWHSIQQSLKPNQSIGSAGDQSYFHDKPPPCLVDNRIGLQSYVKLKGTKLHYIEAGSRHDPLILLLHGFPDCWLGWHNQVSISTLSKCPNVTKIHCKIIELEMFCSFFFSLLPLYNK